MKCSLKLPDISENFKYSEGLKMHIEMVHTRSVEVLWFISIHIFTFQSSFFQLKSGILAEHETGEPETRIFFPSFWVLLCNIFLLINNIRRRGHSWYYLKIGDYFAGTPCEHNMLEGNWRTFLWCTCLSVQWIIL